MAQSARKDLLEACLLGRRLAELYRLTYMLDEISSVSVNFESSLKMVEYKRLVFVGY